MSLEPSRREEKTVDLLLGTGTDGRVQLRPEIVGHPFVSGNERA
jgi:hypothetical protein